MRDAVDDGHGCSIDRDSDTCNDDKSDDNDVNSDDDDINDEVLDDNVDTIEKKWIDFQRKSDAFKANVCSRSTWVKKKLG